mgnify:CR=1 FL=1
MWWEEPPAKTCLKFELEQHPFSFSVKADVVFCGGSFGMVYNLLLLPPKAAGNDSAFCSGKKGLDASSPILNRENFQAEFFSIEKF